MPQMQTHKQLLYKALACTRYHRPNRERSKQKQEMVKYDRNKNNPFKRPGRTSPQRVRVARPKTQPKEIQNPENTKELVERTTRSRQTTKRSSCGIICKPRLPEPMPNQEGHLLERTINEWQIHL